jgi:hypothetical protein
VIAAIVGTLIATLAASEVSEVSPWLAGMLARWSARHRYRSDPDRAEIRAEELAAVVRARPGNPLKIFTAAAFAISAVLKAVPTPSVLVTSEVTDTLIYHMARNMPHKAHLDILGSSIAQHLCQCKRCRRRLWRSHPVAMLVQRRGIIRAMANNPGWRYIPHGPKPRGWKLYRLTEIDGTERCQCGSQPGG